MNELEAHRRNKQQYSGVAANYAASASHAAGEDLEWFAARAGSIVPGVALDVACGGGYSTKALLDAGHRVVGIDLTFESVVEARRARSIGSRVVWACAAAERLPLAPGGASLVGCRIAAHHFADPARFVDEVTRVLSPGGVFLLVDSTVPEDDALARWLNDVESIRDPSHQSTWSPSRWRAVLTGARLRIDETRSVRKHHELGPWLVRAGCDAKTTAEVLDRFRRADELTRSTYQIEFDGDEPVAFSDSKLCVRASKPLDDRA